MLGMNGGVHFAAMNGDLLGSLNPQTHLVTADFDDRDHDVLVDDDALVFFARQNQHGTQLSSGVAGVCRETLASHERRCTANPAAVSVFVEPLIPRFALTRGMRILRRAAQQNQASKCDKRLTAQ